MPFAAYQLSTVILNNVQLRKHFSSNAIEIFSSHIFKNVSSIYFELMFLRCLLILIVFCLCIRTVPCYYLQYLLSILYHFNKIN